jgi:D-alanyl-lipoteichoic acid acyltransferase DltB (MBOAT superfamily)
VSKPKVLRNLMLVMVLGGLWHGADWRFALWGAIHGTLLVVWRLWWWQVGRPQAPSLWRVGAGFAVTFTAVVLTRIFFRATDMSNALAVFHQLFLFTGGLANVSTLVWVTLGAAVVSHYLPDNTWTRLGDVFAWMPPPVRAATLVAMGLVIKAVATFDAQPYVYFQF